MDYEKKYKDALRQAEGIIKYYKERNCDEAAIEDLQEIFPELKESEDERIRKKLIIAFQSLNTIKVWNGIERTDILVWLEKQGNKPKQTSIWKHWKDGIAGNGEGEPIYLVKNGNTYSLNSCLGFECDYIELSELDNLMLEKQGNKPQGKKVIEAIHEQKADNANKIEIVPQTKQEWSDEDEGFLRAAIKTCLENYGQYSEIASWLKSLKQRYISLKQRYIWKPSDKQIRALRWVLNNIPYNTHKEEISGLLEQIQNI